MRIKLCILFFLAVHGFAVAQIDCQRRPELLLTDFPRPAAGFFLEKNKQTGLLGERFKASDFFPTPIVAPLFHNSPPQLRIPDWSADELPFFCRIEHRWDKRTRVPIKFRLGSVDYVDWLEGKREF